MDLSFGVGYRCAGQVIVVEVGNSGGFAFPFGKYMYVSGLLFLPGCCQKRRCKVAVCIRWFLFVSDTGGLFSLCLCIR